MQIQKIVNLLNSSDNESLKLSRKDGMSSTIKTAQTMVKVILMVQALNLGQKISNHIFVIIKMHIFL